MLNVHMVSQVLLLYTLLFTLHISKHHNNNNNNNNNNRIYLQSQSNQKLYSIGKAGDSFKHLGYQCHFYSHLTLHSLSMFYFSFCCLHMVPISIVKLFNFYVLLRTQ